MIDPRSVHSVLMDMENAHEDIRRLAGAVTIIGRYNGGEDFALVPEYGPAVQILGEIIGERVARLDDLLNEGVKLNGRAADA